MERGERGAAVDSLLPVIRTDVWRFVPSCFAGLPRGGIGCAERPRHAFQSESVGMDQRHDGANSIGRFPRRRADWRAGLVTELGDTLGGWTPIDRGGMTELPHRIVLLC